MKHKYPHLLSVLCALIIATSASWAERVSQEDAALVAGNFMSAGDTTSQGAQSPGRYRPLRRVALAEDAQYYVYTNADGNGWVMVAANDIARPIIAYSDEGEFRTDKQPANIKCWLGKYSKQIKQAEADGVLATEEVKQEWKQLRKGTGIRKGTPVVAALIQTKWDQDEPYYNMCPKVGNDYCVTGCVATAMAQVMNYHKWPNTGTGSASVSVNSTTYTVDFSTGNYDWDNMLLKYRGYFPEGSNTWTTSGVSNGTTAQQNAVAKLMYHCGVAADMEYTTEVSGAYTIYPNKTSTTTRCAQYALINNFGYKSSTVKGYSRSGGYGYTAVSDANWHGYLKTELDNARPVMYAGADNEGGHSFICDGYDNTTPTRKYHFNWGWSGYCDGYYDIDNLVPGTGGSGAGNGSYNDNQDIIIGIIPDKPNITITWSVNGVTSTTTQTSGTLVLPATTPSDCSGSGGKKFVGWTASSSVSGSKPADLFTSGTGITVAENKTYYAVYATASEGGSSTPTKATSIAAGDEVILVYENGNTKKEMSGFSSTSTVYGTVADYTTTPAGTYTFEVVAGSSTGTYALKHGSVYANWSSGNSLSSSGTLNDNSSWNISFSDGNAIIANANTSSRTIRYNTSSPRFACYTSGQGDVQLYKMGAGTTYSDYSLTCGVPCSNTPTMSFSPTTVNKTTADASFTKAVTISGKGAGQTVVYSSSDETIATVTNAGVVTLKGKVGSTTITASVAENGTYCAASASYTLNVAAVVCSLSGISLNTTSVQKTFVTGATLDYTGLVVTASYSNCSSKTVNPTTVTVSSSMATAGEKTVTVSYTENSVTQTATYTINVVAPKTVTYMVCGDVFTTQDYAPGAALVLPTETPGGYDGLTFAGWTTTEHHTGASAPADLFSTAGSKTVTADVTYYAVFY